MNITLIFKALHKNGFYTTLKYNLFTLDIKPNIENLKKEALKGFNLNAYTNIQLIDTIII